jgi:hypothetical protein
VSWVVRVTFTDGSTNRSVHPDERVAREHYWEMLSRGDTVSGSCEPARDEVRTVTLRGSAR